MKNNGDMTKGSPFKIILKFAIPILIGNILQQIYGLVDTIIVGKYLGPDKMAAVGLTGNITFFMFSLIIGLSSGIAVVISQFFGAGDKKVVKTAFANSIYIIIGITVIITILGLVTVRPLLEILDTPKDIIDYSHKYLAIIFAGTAVTMLYNWSASILRALGDSITPLIFLIIASIINIVLDIVFIVNLGMDVEGAAYATVISQFVSSILCIIWAYKTKSMLRFKKEDMRFNARLVTTMIRVGIPAGVQCSLIAVSIMLMQKVINGYGTITVAGYVGASKIEQIVTQFGFSIAMAAGTFTGQNAGAGRYDRIDKGYKISCLMVLVCCLVLSPIIFIFGEQLMVLFIDESKNAARVMEIGGKYLRIMSPALFTVGILQIYQQVLRSAGDVAITMIMGGFEIVIRVFIAFWFSSLFGETGIWWATPITWIAAMSLGAARYYTGGWKAKGFVKK